jgi:hypothetical protein
VIREVLAQLVTLGFALFGEERVMDALAVIGRVVVAFGVTDDVEDRCH